MSRRTRWIVAFLAVTALALAGELYAAFDGSSNTTPWTELITRYVPWPVTAVAIGVFVLWLPWHFWTNYREARSVNPLPAVPLSTAADARNRAARTFAQGLALDVAGAVALAVGPALAGTGFAWSRAYWTAVGLLGAKTALQTGAAYVMRKRFPPQV